MHRKVYAIRYFPVNLGAYQEMLAGNVRCDSITFRVELEPAGSCSLSLAALALAAGALAAALLGVWAALRWRRR
ncbi:MAG: hypothetical protein ACUVV6_02645 [Thermoplasmatota archaeon]